ncbi:MAG: hypothetical protein M1825_001335 [Sarcosagium campestre]|nr:MAG: hypothetical protein M1825_001335 [Sarcosagium campestre]
MTTRISILDTPWVAVVLIWSLFAFLNGGNAADLTQALCSNQNTGSDFDKQVAQYMSNGYGFENCGSSSENLFGYVALDKAPLGTQGASSESSQPSTPAPMSTVTNTKTVTASSPARSSADPTSDSSEQSPSSKKPTRTSTSDTSTTSSASVSSTWTPTPITSVETITGALRTVTLTPTEPPQATTPLTQTSPKTGLFSNAGKVAGLFVGLALLILITAGVVIFCLLRRRRRRGESLESAAGDSTPPRTRSRSISELGLISDDRTIMGEKTLPRIQTGGLAAGAGMQGGDGMTGNSPSSLADRRNSQARIIDQRLDPAVVWNPLNDNSSSVSVRSLQDDQDYSRRVLRLANPDK